MLKGVQHDNHNMKHVIGVVGPIASGKGVLISLLQKMDYTVLSLSDVVRAKAEEWGLEMTRENLQNVGDKLRQKFGNAILAEMISGKMQKNPNTKFVVDAIRNPAEVAFLKKEFGVYIIGITADAKKRFALMQKRGKEYDPKTWEEFTKAEQRDRGIEQESYGQQVEKCLALADVILENNGNLSDFEKNVGYFLEKNL